MNKLKIQLWTKYILSWSSQNTPVESLKATIIQIGNWGSKKRNNLPKGIGGGVLITWLLVSHHILLPLGSLTGPVPPPQHHTHTAYGPLLFCFPAAASFSTLGFPKEPCWEQLHGLGPVEKVAKFFWVVKWHVCAWACLLVPACPSCY